MSWPQGQGQRNALVTSEMLEERINMYISAMDRASAIDDNHQSSQLQRDIQRLVDLMEKVSAGYAVTEKEVPPPLAITPQIDVLANPLGELSSRLAEYHKALYFAEEELSENRINKIQNLQRGLKTLHDLQKRAQDGFPVRMDEVPPPVKIPSDDELDNDAVNTLTTRISSYKAALVAAQQSHGFSDRRRVPKIESALRKLEFLMTRAKAKRPVWKRDIPPEFENYDTGEDQSKPIDKTKKTLQIRLLRIQLEKLGFNSKDLQQRVEELTKKLIDLESGEGHAADDLIPSISKEIEKLKKLSASEYEAVNSRKRDLALIEARISEYKTAALNSKKENQTNHAIQHLKIVKSLVPLKEALERGETVDMTLVPPPPRELTPATELPPPISESETTATGMATREPSQSAMAHISPVNIRPAIETAEDKLAKRLTSYLDKGDDSLEHSYKNSNLNSTPNTSVVTPLLPKVQNTIPEAKSPTDGSKDSTGFSLSNMAVLSFENGAGEQNYRSTEHESANPQEITNGSLPDVSKVESSIVKSEQETYDSTTMQSKEVPEPEAFKEMSAHEQEETVTDGISSKTEEKEEETSPQTSPSKSSDIYTRKTLDSVGFLSCQNVPEQLVSPSKEHISNSNEQKAEQSNHTTSSSEIVESQSTQLDSAQDQTPQLPSSGYYKENDSGLSVDSSLNKSNGKDSVSKFLVKSNETEMGNLGDSCIGDKLSATHGLSDLESRMDTSDNVLRTSDGPTSSPLPSSSLHIGLDDFQNGPASLPVVPVATVARDVKSLTCDLPHIPNHASRNASYGPNEDSIESPKHEPQSSELSVSQSQNTAGILKDNEHSMKTEEQNLNETEEFEDLMSSMIMPSMSAPATVPSSLNEQQLQGEQARSSQDWHSEPSGTAVTADASFVENLPSNSGTAAEQRSNYRQENSLAPIEADSQIMSNKSLLSHNSSQDINQPKFDSKTSESFNTQSSFNSPAVWNSQYHDSKGLDENMPQSLSFSTMPESASSRLSQSHSLAEDYSGVTFTCLENLKYEYLLKEAKGTDEDKEGARRLKSDMEQIKYKLHNGGRQTWEAYQACVESELKLLQLKLSQPQSQHHFNDLKLQELRDKKNIAQRELTILQERVPQIKY